MSYSDRLLFVDRPSICKPFSFSSSPWPLGQFQPNLAQSILGWKVIQIWLNEGPCTLPWGDNYEIARHVEFFFENLLQNTDHSSPIIAAVIWLKCCRNGVKHYPINQPSVQSANINRLGTSILGWRGFTFVQMKSHAFF